MSARLLGEDAGTGGKKFSYSGTIDTNTHRSKYAFSHLTKDELESFNIIHGMIAEDEIRYEQRRGNLLDPNLFVDRKSRPVGVGQEYTVKFGGSIRYIEPYAVSDVMMYLENQVKSEIRAGTTRRTGGLHDENIWMLDGKVIAPPYNNIAMKRDSVLLLHNAMRYAKYWEFGSAKSSELKFMKLAATRATRKYGGSFVIKRKMVKYGDLPASSKVKQLMFSKYAKRKDGLFYAQRWANLYPGVQVVMKRGVKYL